MANESLYQVPASTVANMPPELWAHLPQGQGGDASLVTLSTEPKVCNAITRMCPDPRVREFAYTQMHSAVSAANLPVFEQLVGRRYEAATRLGFASHAHRVLDDNMLATDPAEVVRFLRSLAEGLQERANAELAPMLALKRKYEGEPVNGGEVVLEQWDLPLYMAISKAEAHASIDSRRGERGPRERNPTTTTTNDDDENDHDDDSDNNAFPTPHQHLASPRTAPHRTAGSPHRLPTASSPVPPPPLPTPVAGYFPLEKCLSGLALLCDRLFGVTATLTDAPATEAWAGGGVVKKLWLSHPTQGPLGTVYLDLAPRQGKYGHAAHFTVRCGCAIADDYDGPASSGEAADDADEQVRSIKLNAWVHGIQMVLRGDND